MKEISFCVVIFAAILSASAQSTIKKPSDCDLGVSINPNYSKAAKLDAVLTKFAPALIPGAAVAIYSETEGWWAGASGMANLEKKIPMDNCHLQYLQSVAKSFLGVAMLQLKEKGKIDFDAPMTRYLPAKYSKQIKQAEKMTIKMLLNHTSGVPEYNSDPAFLSYVTQHPLENFSVDDIIKAIAGKNPQYAPGSKYQYTNTNYMLLSLIADEITGDHATYIKENIFKPLGMTNSYYGKGYKYLEGLNLPESYWDLLNNGTAINVTGFQRMTVVCSKGDDGIVSTTIDAVKFLKGLMEGKLLQPESLKEMMDFVTDEKGNKRYGIGLIYFDISGLPAYGHGGGGIGAGCGLLYIPSHKVYLFMATNTGVFIESKLAAKADEMRNELLSVLLGG